VAAEGQAGHVQAAVRRAQGQQEAGALVQGVPRTLPWDRALAGSQHHQGRRDKKLVTEWGLRYYWPYAKRDPRNGYVNVTTAVCNYPVQALATAEIIPIALVYLWHRIGAEGLDGFMRIVNTVHDSCPTEVHPDHIGDFRYVGETGVHYMTCTNTWIRCTAWTSWSLWASV
jgi:hypothetical protein